MKSNALHHNHSRPSSKEAENDIPDEQKKFDKTKTHQHGMIQNRTREIELDNTASLRAILNSIEAKIFQIDIDFNLIYFNKNYEQFFETTYKQKPVLYCSIFNQLSKDEFTNKLRELLESAVNGNTSSTILDQGAISFKYKVEPVRNSGRIIAATVFFEDNAERLKQEQILLKQYEELKIVKEELDRFVYSASHDLRAPLMSIKGLVNIMQKDTNAGAHKQYLNHINKSILRLDKFICEIVNYSRNDRLKIQSELIDFNEILEASIDYLKDTEEVEFVEIIKRVSTIHPFYCDRSRLILIFTNLISNAVVYRDKDKKPNVIISVAANQKGIDLSIEDNGIGIAPEHIDNIFNMFYRAHHNSKGAGLGLYNVKNVVDKLKGAIVIRSNVGIGTTVTISIPSLQD